MKQTTTENYFVRNLETNKIEFHFSKDKYLSLSNEAKSLLKSKCLFSNYGKCWVSRSKIDNFYGLNSLVETLGLNDNGETGERLSFTEQIERQQEKAETRQEISEERAEKAVNESKSSYEYAHKLGDMIPMGQPILVGHHSERGHRNHIKKMDNAMRKSCELDEKANYYEHKAANAEKTATGAKFQDAGYLVNRIKEAQASINVIERRLQGKMYHYSAPQPISEADAIHWNKRKTEETEKLNFFTEKLQAIKQETGLFDKDSLKGKTEVFLRNRWEKIVRLNKTTVSIENGCFRDEESRKRWPLKYNYGEIKEAR